MNEALLVADEQARSLARLPGRSILLQAPAGSGKTAVLAQRLLALLCTVEDPGEILAITFTLKAAAEMRARVIRALRGQTPASDPCAAELGRLAAAALQHGAARGWNLRDDPGALRIQTIDAFNYALASQLPLAARAGAALNIADPAAPLYQRAARRTLLAAETDPELSAAAGLLFERLDNHWYRLERLLAQMLAQRGHWLRYVLNREPQQLCAHINASLAAIATARLSALMSALPAPLVCAAQELPGVGALGASCAHLPAWKRLAELALTKQGWRAVLSAKHLGAAYEARPARLALKELIADLQQLAGVEALLREAGSLPAALSDADGSLIAALSLLLQQAAAQLQVQFAQDGRVDYTYLGGAAREALREAGEPTELALRTGLSLKHILVDEFQDTSRAQFDLLASLTAAWEPGDGRTLFVVGDPMQSIYRFRDAEVGLFAAARAHGIGAVPLTALTLTRNYRSTPALVAWFNSTFARVFPAHGDLRTGAVAFSASVAAAEGAAPAGEAVRLRLFQDREREAEAIAARIAELRAQDPRGDIAVLLVAHAHAAPILAALTARGIESRGVDLVPLGERPIVRDLVQLCTALYDLADRSAWLAVLRAPWCGASLATLSALSEPDPAPSIWDNLADPACLERCHAEEIARLTRVREVLAAALGQARMHSPAEWLESTWAQLGGMDAYPAQDLEDARALFDALALRTGTSEWRGPHDFGSLLDELYSTAPTAGEHPVQIMTIHRAKGLQFEHVFVPALDRATRSNDRSLLEWIELPREDGQSDLVMAPIPAIEAEEGGKQVARLVARFNNARDVHERARLLYVAATRARRTLHLSGAPAARADGTVKPKTGTLLDCLWPALEGDFELDPHPAPPSGAPRRAPQSLRRLIEAWRAPELPAVLPTQRLHWQRSAHESLEFSWVGETQRHIGTIVHALLARAGARGELAAGVTVPTHAALMDALRLQGVPERARPAAAEHIVSALKRTFADERGRWILGTHRGAASELALTGIAHGRLRSVVIDRSFIDESGTRWVIDYKTSRHEGGDVETFLENEMRRYRAQLEGYVALAAALGPQPVRAGLYFPLLGAFRELP
jgi:ATP-dependent helicase/nuclease subunit A